VIQKYQTIKSHPWLLACLLAVTQHPPLHQLWMRLFWPFWDELNPFNLNQTKPNIEVRIFFFFFHWLTFPLDFKTPLLPSFSLLFLLLLYHIFFSHPLFL
jgi:hypothetical protein